MINEEKINYLNQFTLSNNTIEILNYTDVINIESNIIPDKWKVIFSEPNKDTKTKKLMDIWVKHVRNELKNVISFLNEFLIDAELIKIGEKYSILYSIKTLDEKIRFYKADNPMDKFNNNALQRDWGNIPSKIREFYESVHNGFYEYQSGAMGLRSFNNIGYLDDFDWGIVDEIGEENISATCC